jgi:hypothetical protein
MCPDDDFLVTLDGFPVFWHEFFDIREVERVFVESLRWFMNEEWSSILDDCFRAVATFAAQNGINGWNSTVLRRCWQINFRLDPNYNACSIAEQLVLPSAMNYEVDWGNFPWYRYPSWEKVERKMARRFWELFLEYIDPTRVGSSIDWDEFPESATFPRIVRDSWNKQIRSSHDDLLLFLRMLGVPQKPTNYQKLPVLH